MRGVFYIATGQRCCKEAMLSAQRCRIADINLPITIQTDLPDYPGLADVFDSVVVFQTPEDDLE